jgi:hypothetical protein
LDTTPDEYLTNYSGLSLDAEKVSGDNYRDLVVLNVSSGGRCYRNLNSDTPPYFTLQSGISLYAGWQVRFGQLRDPQSYPKDLVWSNSSGLVKTYFNDNDGSLTLNDQFDLGEDNGGWVAIGRINNNNNYNDVAIHPWDGNYAGNVYRFFNDGDGNLTEQAYPFASTGYHGRIELADLDPSTWQSMPELLVMNEGDGNPGTLKIYDNNNNGSFVSTPRQTLTVGQFMGTYGNDFTVGDINDDGFPDIVTCMDNYLKCFLNDGTGYFTDNYQPVPSGFYFRGLVLTNLDGDRYPDLVVLCYNSSGSGTYLKGYLNTNGVFSTTASYTGTVGSGYLISISDLIATDLSGDGATSLICTGYEYNVGNGFWAFKNHGNPAPMSPRHFTIQADQNENPYLSWTANEEDDITSYKIWRALTLSPDLSEDVTFTQIGEVNHPTNHFTDEDVYLHQPTFNYMIWYYVTALDDDDNQSIPGDTINFRGLYHPQSNGPDLVVSPVQPTGFSINASPNPFNPATTINFSLPEISMVNIAVYDANGRQVAQLVNGMQDAGQHQVTFDGSNLASGVYLYRLTAGLNSATGKMVLLK